MLVPATYAASTSTERLQLCTDGGGAAGTAVRPRVVTVPRCASGFSGPSGFPNAGARVGQRRDRFAGVGAEYGAPGVAMRPCANAGGQGIALEPLGFTPATRRSTRAHSC